MDTTVISPLIDAWETRNSQPFTLIGDDIVIGILLLCFLIIAFALADRSHYIHQLIYGYSFGHSRSQSDNIRTSRSFYLRTTLILQSFISFALIIAYFFWRKGYITDSTQCWKYIVAGTVAAGLYMFVKFLLYLIVNSTLYSKKQTDAWTQVYGDTFIFAGILFFVFAVVCISFEVSLPFVVIGMSSILGLIEIWLIIRAFHIFFTKRYGLLQLFVYLCTLEIIPLLVIGKILLQLSQIF
ncbi:MAG: DUF4271 domain-containing protein [Bacteroidaceae bacterium]|nr:DUF4271 domain-containing protein [Bacteroidaceae bacterium]